MAIHGSVADDQEQGYTDAGSQSAEQLDIDLLNDGLRVVRLASSDLALVGAAAAVVAEAIAAVGPLADLVVNHAYSVCQEFGTWTEADIDSHLSVNVRSSMMSAQSFAAQFPPRRDGAITLMASGQYLGPMVSEVAYAVSKEAVRNLTTHLAAILAPGSIRTNCVNPGPTDTGYLTGAAYEAVRQRFPTGRWGTPNDVSALIAFLHSADGGWIMGQCIGSEGGFES